MSLSVSASESSSALASTSKSESPSLSISASASASQSMSASTSPSTSASVSPSVSVGVSFIPGQCVNSVVVFKWFFGALNAGFSMLKNHDLGKLSYFLYISRYESEMFISVLNST